MTIGRKGSALDMIFIMFSLMVFGIFILVGMYLTDTVFTPLSDMFNGTAGSTTLDTVKQGYGTMDNIFMFLFFMLNLVPVIFAVFVRTHPVFLIVNLLVIFVYMFLAPSMSNIMLEFWGQPEFAPYALGGGGSYTFNVMTRLFQYLPYISVGLAVIVMVAMFVKQPEGGVSL